MYVSIILYIIYSVFRIPYYAVVPSFIFPMFVKCVNR